MQAPTVQAEIKKYLETGDHDMLFLAWQGTNHFERINRGHEETMTALVEAVKQRTVGAEMPEALQDLDVVELGRRKAEPMVRGLFPKAEQEQVLSLLDDCVVFLTPDNIESVIRDGSSPSSSWSIANLYLSSTGAAPLSKHAPAIVGMSEEQTCYVSPAYFTDDHPYADFVVHEMAHVFHNCKRRTAGLKKTRTKEWLLNINFSKREEFAYACEAYSRILERSKNPTDRRALAEQFKGFDVEDDQVNRNEVVEIVRAACQRRKGWKVILARCAPEGAQVNGHGTQPGRQ
ncbi:MAG: hypothetical protein R6V56_03780 [Lentisphaeria bacterium]